MKVGSWNDKIYDEHKVWKTKVMKINNTENIKNEGKEWKNTN